MSKVPAVIASFSGEYGFLSNFYPCDIEALGMTFASVEHAYQASKCFNLSDMKKFSLDAEKPLSAGAAKRLGKKIEIRHDWLVIKEDVMCRFLMQKFSSKNPIVRRQLIDTGDAVLIEGNNWGDKFWGVDKTGENKLGFLLMEIRELVKLNNSIF